MELFGFDMRPPSLRGIARLGYHAFGKQCRDVTETNPQGLRGWWRRGGRKMSFGHIYLEDVWVVTQDIDERPCASFNPIAQIEAKLFNEFFAIPETFQVKPQGLLREIVGSSIFN